MTFPLNTYLLAGGAAFATSWLSLPLWRNWCARLGLVDDPGHRKLHLRTVPLAGGLAVATGILVPLAAGLLALHWRWLDLSAAAKLSYGFGRRRFELGAILAGAVGMLAVGIWDDWKELKPSTKFLAQVLTAGMVAAGGARITLFVDNRFFSYAVTILWILTVTNAFNFMDNMNGLCAGLGVIAALCFGLMAAWAGQYLVALTAWLTAGALAGFLPHNYPKASAFLGDGGSQLTGYLMAVLAILPHFYTARHPRVFAVLTPVVVLGIALGDLVWVVLLRWSAGKPFYLGDNNHLSHRLTRKGFTPRGAVLLIWLLAAGAGVLGLCLEAF
jgi:UDP-GlcNAc:undecaprenyl-phosphate GlcNAc-1-phosphate transferase